MVPLDVLDAVRDADIAPVKRWLDDGGSPDDNLQDPSAFSLMCAALLAAPDHPNEILEIVRLLATRGASLNSNVTVPDLEWSPTYVSLAINAVAVNHDAIVVLELLLELGADPNIHGIMPRRSFPMLVNALMHSQIAVVRLLIKHGASLETAFDGGSFTPDAVLSIEEYDRKIRETSRHPSHQIDESFSFIYAVRAAGGTWRGYLAAPRRDLNTLRVLCARGRATPPPGGVLALLFPQDATGNSASAPLVLPPETWWLVVSFWKSGRDD